MLLKGKDVEWKKTWNGRKRGTGKEREVRTRTQIGLSDDGV